MKERFDYGKNPLKTKDGELILAYECDPATVDAEFALSKARYKAITGREQKKDADILCYQIRQSFQPGEIDPEGALKVGYELAMRWTKSRHAFFVVSHIDRPHPHVHIYYNSTTLDCTRKFRDFIGSARAVRRLSDQICIEHRLSCIINPKLHSKGKYKHYGEWLVANKAPNFKERLKMQIALCLEKQPKSFEAFLQMMKEAGYEIKHGRGGAISFGIQGQERFTRLRSATLGKGYDREDIQAVIERQSTTSGGHSNSQKVNLIIDIQNRMRDGKGPGYERWAKIFNLKQMAETLQYLQEHNLLEYEQLEKQADTITEHFHTLSDQIKSIEKSISRNKKLKNAVINYAKTRTVFEGYKATKYSRKFYSEHEAELEIYRSAQADFKRLLDGEKLPKMAEIKSEYDKLTDDKKSVYREYRTIRKEMQDIITVKANIDHLLEIAVPEKAKEKER